MRSRYTVRELNAAHFITCTVVEWLPLFTSAACCDIIVNSLLYCREHKGLVIYAWVILENHFHAIVAGPELSNTIRDLKKFTARQLIAQLATENRDWLLETLRWHCPEYRDNCDYRVWQEGFHPKAILSDAIMQQKLEYLHNNPIERGFVARPEHWRYSSAHEWRPESIPLLRCDPWR